MKEVFEQNYHCYGSPRLVKALKYWGIGCGKTRVRFRPRTTLSDPYLPSAPNVVATLPPVATPAQRFHSDITYISTQEGLLYLAVTVDAFTRRCSGWCVRDNMEAQLVKDAARIAFGEASVPGGLHHSDRGSQYASERFRLLLEKEQILQSMSRKGNCYDNTLSESFWATVKTECFDNFRDGITRTRAQVLESLFHYIELFYNRVRMHSALRYKSPVQFECDWKQGHITQNVST